MSAVLWLDPDHLVLYAKREGEPVADTREAPHDGYLFLSYSRDGRVVGAKLLFAHELAPDEWRAHPDRGEIPGELLQLIDGWFANEWLTVTEGGRRR